MDYVYLGKSGLQVSPVCLGTLTFGREADEATSFVMMDYFAEEGFNFIDTADVYSTGVSETIVGRWMKERRNRSKIILATKVYGRMDPGPNEAGLSRIHIQMAVEKSLRRLQTEVIDLYQIHRWDPQVPPQETLEVLHDLRRQGKLRYIGRSNLSGWQLAQCLSISDVHQYSRFVSIQPLYNALNRGIELEILPLCSDQGLGIIPYNPLAGGVLTGKYKRNIKLPEGSRLDVFQPYRDRYLTESTLDIVDRFLEAAKKIRCNACSACIGLGHG